MTMQGFFCTLIAAILGGYFGWCAATVHGLASLLLVLPGAFVLGIGMGAISNWLST